MVIHLAFIFLSSSFASLTKGNFPEMLVYRACESFRVWGKVTPCIRENNKKWRLFNENTSHSYAHYHCAGECGAGPNRELRQPQTRRAAAWLDRHQDRLRRSEVDHRERRYGSQPAERPKAIRSSHISRLHQGRHEPQRRLRGSEIQAPLRQGRPGGWPDLAG